MGRPHRFKHISLPDSPIINSENKYSTAARELTVPAKTVLIKPPAYAYQKEIIQNDEHQQRVAELSFAMSLKLGLPFKKALLIYQAAQLHDFGKKFLDPTILYQPTRLNKHDYKIVKQHPEIGSYMLRYKKLPMCLAEVALQHHEKLDGSGYPFGLKENSISLPARIIAVADTFDALTSQRPYKASLPSDKAFNIIRSTPKAYDQKIVDTLEIIVSKLPTLPTIKAPSPQPLACSY